MTKICIFSSILIFSCFKLYAANETCSANSINKDFAKTAHALAPKTVILVGEDAKLFKVDKVKEKFHDRSKFKTNFDLNKLMGKYKLIEESGDEGCITYKDREERDDNTISIKYDYRKSSNGFLMGTDHYLSLDVSTSNYAQVSFLSNIDQGPRQYTRHDVENDSVFDYVTCMALIVSKRVTGAAFCQEYILSKSQPKPDFNPSFFVKMNTETTKDNEIISENMTVERPTKDMAIITRSTTSLKLDGKTLTLTKKTGLEPSVTVQKCVYEKAE